MRQSLLPLYWQMSAFLVVCTIIQVSQASRSGSPLSLQKTEGFGVVLNASAINPAILNRLGYVDEFSCPPNMHAVRSERREFRGVLGCIPVNHTACTAANQPHIIGTCPLGMSCCTEGSVFVGCAEEPERCCFSDICGEGYGCCGNRVRQKCCPLPAGHGGFIVANQPFCTDSRVDGACADNVTAPLSACPTNNLEITTSIFCQPGDECIYERVREESSEIVITEIPLFVEPLNPANTTRLPVGCCPSGHDPCFDSGDFIGCANPALGEVCCGDSVCPSDTKCCALQYNTTFTNMALSSTILAASVDGIAQTFVGCCPDTTACCFANRSRFHPSETMLLNNVTVDQFGTLQQPGLPFCGISFQTNDPFASVSECDFASNVPPVVSSQRYRRQLRRLSVAAP